MIDFITTVEEFSDKGEINEGIDFIFEHIDNLLSEDKFSECNDILRSIDCSSLNHTLLTSFLAITLCAKEKLKNRKDFYCIVRKIVMIEKGWFKTNKILRGLQ